MKRQLLQIALACAALVAFVAFNEGCSLQGEGQRCSKLNDVNNVSEDCESGLECVSKNVLGTNSDICCPANGGQSEEPACIPGRLNGGAASSSSSSSGATTATTTATATSGAGGSGGMGGAGGGM